MASSNREADARRKAEMIMKVRCGLLTASQAAEALGVSRKTIDRVEKVLNSGVDDGRIGAAWQAG